MKQTVKKITSLVLVLALSLVFLPLRADASTFSEDRSELITTWKNSNGKTITGIITQGCEVLSACTNPKEGQAHGFITSKPNESTVSPYIADERQVSDYFYLQIYGDNNKLISKYKVTVTGMVSRVGSNRYITSVEFSRRYGDACLTTHEITGYTALAIIEHPVEGYLGAHITLGSGGTFTITDVNIT